MQGRGQTGRTDLVEAIQERESCPVVNPAETRANDGLVVVAKNLLEQATTRAGRIRDGNSRRPIRLFKVVEARAVVGRTTEVECNRRFRRVPQTLSHILHVLRKLRSQSEGRRRLQSVGLPGRRKERPAQSVGQCEVRFDAPGVLPVELVGVEPIVALHRSALRQHVAVLVQVIVGDDVRDHAVQSEQRAVIGGRGERLRQTYSRVRVRAGICGVQGT